jgi:hypothetical protein
LVQADSQEEADRAAHPEVHVAVAADTVADGVNGITFS